MPRKTKQPNEEPTPKTRVELRFDPELYKRLHTLTTKLDISVNRFLEAITQWAVDNAVLGTPVIQPNGFVEVRPDPGVVFFGHPSPNISGTLCPGTVHFAIEFNRPWAIRHSGHFNTDTGLYDT